MKKYIGCEAHARHSIFASLREDGGWDPPVRVEHKEGEMERYLKQLPAGTPVAVESSGNWYWLARAMEAAGVEPRLAHALEKRMPGRNKTDGLDARGWALMLRNGSLPEVWIPPAARAFQCDKGPYLEPSGRMFRGVFRGVPLLGPDTIEIRPPDLADAVQPVAVLSGSPRFFETMGIPLVGGREFRPGELNGAIVSQTLAKLFWYRRSPLGRRLDLPDGTALTVVGIAKDIGPLRFGGTDNPLLYRSLPANVAENAIVIHFDARLDQPVLSVRAAIRDVEPDLPVRIRLMQNWIDQVSSEIWNFVSLILLLGILATILSMAGIYGTVSFAVKSE